MKKCQVNQFYPWSAEYVIAHAIRKSKRGNGRKPSASYRGIRNPLKALEFAKKMAEDKEIRDLVITSTSDSSITTSDGWSFFVDEKWGVVPCVGDIARFYGEGIGRPVRGLDINGVECFYLTKEQQRAKFAEEAKKREQEQRDEFEKNRASFDERFNNLPELFQKRIEKFRTNNPDFRWKYEAYEFFCCEQAIVIFSSINQQVEGEAEESGLTVEQYKDEHTQRANFLLQEFANISWEEQKEKVSDLDDGHSGNTLGCAMKLASLYTSNQPDNIVKLHGALAPLVGSEEYGCISKAV